MTTIMLLMEDFVSHMLTATPEPEYPWGFPLHSSCWTLMGMLLGSVDRHRIFGILLSFPVYDGILDWGHDYGGLISRRNTSDESLLEGIAYGKLSYAADDDSRAVYTFDPMNLPAFEEFLVATDHEYFTQNASPPAVIQPDIFAKLPLEILQQVLNILASKDVVSLKIASRFIRIVPLFASFWALRFMLGHEYGHVFEARQFLGRSFNWKSFYLKIKSLDEDENLQNRKRISKLILRLRSLIFDKSLDECQGTHLSSYLERGAFSWKWKNWLRASRDVVDPNKAFNTSGCRVLKSRGIIVSKQISNIYVSTIEYNGCKYVSGLRFEVGDDSTSIGYMPCPSDSRLEAIYLNSQESGPLSGFHVAMDTKGLRGISFLVGGRASRWIGEYEDIPKKQLVLEKGDVHFLQADCDVSSF